MLIAHKIALALNNVQRSYLARAAVRWVPRLVSRALGLPISSRRAWGC